MNRIRTLDGLRGLAILLVLAGHTTQHYPGLSADTRGWTMAFANSGLGVRIFFVLSGYLITELLLREHERSGSVNLRAFYLRRARRILPAFYVFLGAVALWTTLNPPAIAPALWWSAATFSWNYAFNWIAGWTTLDAWNLAHTWSLAVEAQFYLLWPAALVCLGARRALPVAILLLVASPFIRLGSYALFEEQRGYLGMMLHTSADGLLAGCIVALLGRKAAFVSFIQRHGPSGTALALVWMFLLGPVATHELRGFTILGGFSLDALAAGWIVARFHLSPPGWALRFFGAGVMPVLGVISYSLYLWQQLFLGPRGWLAGGNLLVALGAALAVASVSYWCVERPFLKTRPKPSAATP